MTQSEAATLVAKLFAAFPFHRDNDELTAAVYVEQIVRLRDADVALKAINDLIAGERYLPVIAQIREQYAAVLKRIPGPLELNEAPLTTEERAENLRQANAVLEMLRARKQDPGTGDVPWFDRALADGALLADEIRNGES